MWTMHTTIQRTSACVAIFNNLLLIYLIVYRSHQQIGKYKYLMIYISIFELFYAVFDACSVPIIYSKDSSFMVVVRADQAYLPSGYLIYFSALFCVLFGISMAIFAVHFIYRYLVVSGSSLLKNYDKQIITALLGFPLVFGVFWFGVAFYFLHPYTEGNEHLRTNYLNKNNLTLADAAYIGPMFWPMNSNGNLTIWWKSVFGIGLMTAGIAISFLAIIFFGYKCYRETQLLIDHATQSSSFNKLQKQLFIALVLQTIIPVVLMHIPASIGFSAAFFNVSVEPFGYITSITICLYPSLDPLPNFFIIKSYRDAIIETIKKTRNVILCRKAVVGILAAPGSVLIQEGESSGLRVHNPTALNNSVELKVLNEGAITS